MKKNIIKAVAVSLSVLSLAGCTKNFETYNTNPHEATPEQAAPVILSALFQQMERNVIFYRDGSGILDSDYQIIYNLCAETWAGYLAPTLGDGRNNGSFQINDGWSRAMFNYKYSHAMNAWNKYRKKAEEVDSQPYVMAIANLLKVVSMQQVTDYYGPIPYTEFGASVNPAYDSQEVVYKTMLKELDEAIEILGDYKIGNPGAGIFSDFDVVYGGDVEKWLKLANSVRLRLAMRIVYAEPALAKEEAEKSLGSSFGLILANADNATVTGVDHHPLYVINVDFNDADTQMGASMDSYLNGYNDPRMFCIAKPAKDGKLHGVRSGIHTTNWTPYKNTANNVSAPNATAYKVTWINAAEVNFLCAEAALRGWNVSGGSAKDYYEAGIRASFEEWGANDADRYIANSTAKPAAFVDITSNGADAAAPGTCTIAYNAADNFETCLEKIITQKWIAVYPNGCEAWAEYRRTRYPKLITPANNDSNGVVDSDLQIRRVPFPVPEQTNNPKGLAAGIAALGGPDNAGTKLWWDKK